ncbi:MAG: hypothetical protein AAFV26_02875 [Pseudomonadota bacterium]
MRSSKKTKSIPESIPLPGRFHGFLLFVALLALTLAIATSLLFVVNELPLFMKALLGVVVLSAFATVVVCISFMCGKSLEFTPHELIVHSVTGAERHRWVDIEAVKVVGASGCFGDNPFTASEKRIALALFKKGGREGRAEAHEADDIIISGDIDKHGERYVRVTQYAAKAIRMRETATRGKPAAAAAPAKRIGEARQARTAAA